MGRKRPFLSDIKTLRARARKHIEQGAVTAGYRADRETVVKLLNDALATEIVCVLRYRRHHFMAAGMNADPVAQEFLVHANEEQQHADQIAARIVQLNGERDTTTKRMLEGILAMEEEHADDLVGLLEEAKS
jgi:bacterioferritin